MCELKPLGMTVKALREKPKVLDLFYAKSDKNQKILFCKPVLKFQKISTLNICDGPCIQ